MNKEYRLSFVTPAFWGGSSPTAPEARVPSIRGQVRWWFRALGAGRELESAVFGAVHPKANASAVVMRLLSGPIQQARPFPVLPHKMHERNGFPRSALPPDTVLRLLLQPRTAESTRQFELACLAVETWVWLGAVGFRSNRGAGAVWPDPAPKTAEELREQLKRLRDRALMRGLWTVQSPLGRARIDLLNLVFATPEEARETCSDTVKDDSGILGYAKGKERQASPLKAKVVRIGNEYAVLRIAFSLNSHPADAGIRRLAASSKSLGGSGTPLL